MPRRVLMCPVVGAGTFANPYRPKGFTVAGLRWGAAVIQPEVSLTRSLFAVAVDVATLTLIANDPTIGVFPVVAMLDPLSDADRQAIRDLLTRFGLPTVDADAGPTLRAVLLAIARNRFDARINADQFDPPTAPAT